MKMGSKGATEIAKTVGKAVELGRDIGTYLKEIVGPGLSELGEAFTDQARVWRYENSLRLADKVHRIHAARGIVGPPRLIPMREALPLLSHALNEDKDELVDLWAALLANASDPAGSIQARRIFTSLLANLEPLDASVLKCVRDDMESNPTRHQITQDESRSKRNSVWICAVLGNASHGDVLLSLDNLERLGLLEDERPNLDLHPALPIVPVPLTNPSAEVTLTYTASELLKACAR